MGGTVGVGGKGGGGAKVGERRVLWGGWTCLGLGILGPARYGGVPRPWVQTLVAGVPPDLQPRFAPLLSIYRSARCDARLMSRSRSPAESRWSWSPAAGVGARQLESESSWSLSNCSKLNRK